MCAGREVASIAETVWRWEGCCFSRGSGCCDIGASKVQHTILLEVWGRCCRSCYKARMHIESDFDVARFYCCIVTFGKTCYYVASTAPSNAEYCLGCQTRGGGVPRANEANVSTIGV